MKIPASLKRLFVIYACSSFLFPIMVHSRSRDGIVDFPFGGIVRTYYFHQPLSRAGSDRIPLLIVLHGAGGTGKGMVKLTNGEFDSLADRDDFYVVYPDGINKHWNDGRTRVEMEYKEGQVPDDVAFISALVDTFVNSMNVDPKRVYVTGMSNGATMTYRLGFELSDKLAAIASVDGDVIAENADTGLAGRPLSVLVINNTKDPLMPWGGGNITGPLGLRKLGKVFSVRQSVSIWVKRDGCGSVPVVFDMPDKDPDDGTRVTRESYSGGNEGTEVILYAIEGGGHTWPGGSQYLPAFLIGKTCRDIKACDIIWDFFRRHVRN